MAQGKEIRFTTFIDEYTQCEVFATVENGEPVIHSVNIVGDGVITFDDLDEDGQRFFLSEVRRVMAGGQKS